MRNGLAAHLTDEGDGGWVQTRLEGTVRGVPGGGEFRGSKLLPT